MKRFFLSLFLILGFLVGVTLGEVIYVDANNTGVDGITVTLGTRQTILAEGAFGLKYFPDGSISVLQDTPIYPFRIIIPGGYTSLVEGTDLDNLSSATDVLGPGEPGTFDNGYAGINGIYYHSDGKLYGYYHAEDHEDMPGPGTGGIPGYYSSIGVAVSSDNGYTWQKLGQVLTSSLPKDPNGPTCQGIGVPSIIVDKTGTYLYMYYGNYESGRSSNGQLCMARVLISDPDQPPVSGKWKKYYDGFFTEDGIGGLDSPILGFSGYPGVNCPHVVYSAYLEKYMMVLGVYAHGEYVEGTGPEVSGIYIAYSEDGIHWSIPYQLIQIYHHVLPDEEIGVQPSIVWEDSIGQQGRLVYGYSERWGHSPPQIGHYMVGHSVSFGIGENDGTNWSSAYRSLRYAIGTAMPGDEIWVAEGTYKPDQGPNDPNGSGNRYDTFQLRNGVSIYGGFPPGGGTWAEHSPTLHETILSGDLDGNDVQVDPCDLLIEPTRNENSYHVITANGNNSTAVLDGFTITAGNASESSWPDFVGAGIFISGGSPIIRNCKIIGNLANYDGAGMRNHEANPTLTNCIFAENAAKIHGGGIYNSYSSPTLTGCIISGNLAVQVGGGMVNNQNSNPKLINCAFVANSAVSGGGILNNDSSPELTNCTFTNNSAESTGGGISNTNSSPVLTNCSFTSNFAVDTGGGMRNSSNSSPELSSCTFVNNSTDVTTGWGGGMSNGNNSNPSLTNCTFNGNTAGSGAGLASNDNSNPIVNNCYFLDNSATNGGGGVLNNNSSPAFTCCIFSGNRGTWGGGLNNSYNSAPTVKNCVFSGNIATAIGGGMTNNGDSLNPMVINCTFSGNHADQLGGGMYNFNNSSPVIINSILWENSDLTGESESGQIYTDGPNPIVNYSCIQGLTGSFGGIGNISNDPFFVYPGYWDSNSTPNDANDDFWVDGDYHLKSQAGRWDPNSQSWEQDTVTSLCIDAGNPGSPLGTESNEPNNIRINMGAFGGTTQASKSPNSWGILADLTNDSIVNFSDFAAQSEDWMESAEQLFGDLNRNGLVDLTDLSLFAEDWLKEIDVYRFTRETEQIVVDFSTDLGPATYRASGFLHGISPTLPDASMLNPLKPQTFRMRADTVPGGVAGAFDTYERIVAMGAKLQVLISDTFGYVTYGAPNWPGDNGDWEPWESCVTNLVNEANQAGYDFEWDIWEEPDYDVMWNPSGDKISRFFETWTRAYQIIRALDPNAIIIGPSNSYYSSLLFSVEDFLLFAKDNDVLPDVLSWHVWNEKDVIIQVEQARTFMVNNGINIERISLNEIVYETHNTEPGILAWYFANAEAVAIDSACHACWPDQNGVSSCLYQCLDGLLTLPERQPRSTWWVYKSYADITGELVSVTASTHVNGVAGKDTGLSESEVLPVPHAKVLLGKREIDFEGSECDVILQLKGMGDVSYLKNNSGEVKVIVEKIPDSGWDSLESPEIVCDEVMTFSDTMSIRLTGFGPTDAYFVSFYNPDMGKN